ncbi:MAG: MBG domain-containing protein [Bryobacteraceae bacterium]
MRRTTQFALSFCLAVLFQGNLLQAASATWAPAGSLATGPNGSGSITINQATPTVTVTGLTTTYDATSHPATVTITGVSGDNSLTASLVTLTYTPGASTAPVNAGSYTVVGSFPGNQNYKAVASSQATITINPAPLSITANSLSRYFRTANATFTISYLGFEGGQGSGVLDRTLTCGSLAVAGSDVGMYPITCGGLTSPNYAITFVAGTLAITPAPTSTALISAVTRSGGAAKITLTATVTSTVVPVGAVAFSVGKCKPRNCSGWYLGPSIRRGLRKFTQRGHASNFGNLHAR